MRTDDPRMAGDKRASLGSCDVLCVVGARPNFMKIAPVMRALAGTGIDAALVHTGQHYDVAMQATFFEQLSIPQADVDLGVGSGSHARQTADIMSSFEPVLDQAQPRAILVVGDVNSTIACALVASKKDVPVIHVEAGLRSFDRTMPEEINRVLTDQLSTLLFTTEREAAGNLAREGIVGDRVHFVGNVMIDTLRAALPRAVSPAQVLAAHDSDGIPAIESGGYGMVTIHRPSNVDDPQHLARLVTTLEAVAERLPLVFPVHPRTRAALERGGLWNRLSDSKRIAALPPLGYLETLGLLRDAGLVLTDSGGVQEESTALGIPCLTLRENTERPVTVTEGTNTVVGTERAAILEALDDVLRTGGKAGRVPELWDGRAAERIATVVSEWLGSADVVRASAE